MMNIHQCVVFAILMENNQGILSKAPGYIWKKYKSCSVMRDDYSLSQLLDMSNQAKFEQWLERWEK